MTTETPRTAPKQESLLSGRYRWTTIGSNALIFLAAFETLAVTTVMPTISEQLNGQALYSLAFSSTLAASVIGMVVVGGWSDRRGPARPLVAAMLMFMAGLIVSGAANDMAVFIVGRFLQGLGSGGVGVALYVVVARLYPPVLHPRIFGTFATAWVLPSLIGPPLAGVVADTISWHWVFLGVGLIMIPVGASIIPALRRLWSAVPSTDAAGSRWGVAWAIVVAAGAVAISLGSALGSALGSEQGSAQGEAPGGDSGGAWQWVVAGVCLVVIVIALRPLLPHGTLRLARGLPAAVMLRGAIAAAFFSTEVYLPYMLHDQYGLPSWLSGLILTVGAISWAIGAAVQSRFGERMSHDSAVRIGVVLLVVGIATQLVTAALMLSPFVAAAGWFVAGGGMGLIFPRLSTVVLGHSTERDQGFNSAAMSIADGAGAATAIAFAGLAFAAAGGAGIAGDGTGADYGDGAGAGYGFVAALALTTALAVAAVPAAFRVRKTLAGRPSRG